MATALARQSAGPSWAPPSAGSQPEAREAGVEIDVIDTRERFDALAAEWDSLHARAATPGQVFQSHAWLSAWADYYLGDGDRLTIIAGWRQGVLAMVWPLVVVRRLGMAQLVWMGAPTVQYGDALIEDSEDAQELMLTAWNTARLLPVDLILLNKTRADARAAPILRLAGLATLHSEYAPYLDFAGATDWTAFERAYDPKIRSSRRRLARRLRETGGIDCARVAPGPIAGALAWRAVAMKRERFRSHGRIAPVIGDARFANFLADVARHGNARVCVIRQNGAAIGIEMSLVSGGRSIAYLIAHDQRFDKQGLGVSLAEFSLRSAMAEGAEGCDLLAPSDAYKLDWAQTSVRVDDLGVALTPLGKLYLRGWRGYGRARIKALARRMPRWLGRALAALPIWSRELAV